MTAAAVVPEWVFGGRLVRCGMPHPIWRTDCFTLVTCHPVTLCLACVVCIKTCPLNGLCSTPTIAGGVPTGSPPLNKKKYIAFCIIYIKKRHYGCRCVVEMIRAAGRFPTVYRRPTGVVVLTVNINSAEGAERREKSLFIIYGGKGRIIFVFRPPSPL